MEFPTYLHPIFAFNRITVLLLLHVKYFDNTDELKHNDQRSGESNTSSVNYCYILCNLN